jgi:hypothetical protein
LLEWKTKPPVRKVDFLSEIKNRGKVEDLGYEVSLVTVQEVAKEGRKPGVDFGLIDCASMVEWFSSRRDSTIVARHEVPG